MSLDIKSKGLGQSKTLEDKQKNSTALPHYLDSDSTLWLDHIAHICYCLRKGRFTLQICSHWYGEVGLKVG